MGMKIWGGRGREVLYICCVYMPTDSSSVSVIQERYASLKEDVLVFKQKRRVVLQWREGLIVNLLNNGGKEDPGNYRDTTLGALREVVLIISAG